MSDTDGDFEAGGAAVYLPDPEATHEAGRKLGERLRGGEVLALTGTLGAGKTHLTQGIARGLGAEEMVTSPTFALVHEYEGGRFPIYHFDFYRLETDLEVLELGWDEYLEGKGVVIVEWADLHRPLIPRGAQWWVLEHEENKGGRRLRRVE